MTALQLARHSRLVATVSALAVAQSLTSTACRPSALAMGTSVDAAARNGDSLFVAFARRFTNVQRDPKFSRARQLMGKYALTPARLYGDTAIWTAENDRDSTRLLTLTGTPQLDGYLFRASSRAPYPTQVGDERHVLQLKRLGEDELEWHTIVDHAIGPIRPHEAAAAIGAVFTSFDGHTAADARGEARATFPRASRQLGWLFAIDSLATTPNADGSTSARFAVRIQPDSMRRRYPNYAAYLGKYVVPSTYRIQLTDHHGGTFLHAEGQAGRTLIRLKARGGKLVPLEGPPRSMPDSLLMRIDFSAKFKIFRVGFRNLVADFTVERSEHEQAWMWRFRKEPEWHFPLAFDKLIKVPLRRPFAGRGAELRLGVRDDLGAQTMSYRVARIAVRESAIMRWLGGLGATAFGDFADRTEIEESQFLSELFTALQQDIAALR